MVDTQTKKDRRANLKISPDLHIRLKTLAAKSRGTMEELAEAALEKLLVDRAAPTATQVSQKATEPQISPPAEFHAERPIPTDILQAIGRLADEIKLLTAGAGGESSGSGVPHQQGGGQPGDFAAEAIRRAREARDRALGGAADPGSAKGGKGTGGSGKKKAG